MRGLGSSVAGEVGSQLELTNIVNVAKSNLQAVAICSFSLVF